MSYCIARDENVKFKACEVLKIKELTFVSDYFQYKHNAEIDVYDQAINEFFSAKSNVNI